jgi:hypothetical protein
MNVVIQLLNNKEIAQQVKKKILQLIQLWGLRFEDDADVLPLFSNVYSALKQRSLPFPDEGEAKVQVRKLNDALDGKAPMPDSKPLDKKHLRLKKDLEVVIQNIVLTNEMIDAHDLADDIEENDAIVSLAESLRTFENKIMELIEKIKNDDVMNLALMINDDLQKTLKRYRKVKHGRDAGDYKPECRKYLPGYKGTPEKEKNKPKSKQSDPPKQKEQPRQQPAPQEDDIFGFSDGPSQPSSNQSHSQAAAPKQEDDDIFGVDFNAPSQAPAQKADSGVNKLNEIMERMNLEKQQQQNAPNQFQTAGPGMYGGGMPGQGFNNNQPGGFGGGNFGGGNPGFGGQQDPFGGPPGGFGGPSPGGFGTAQPGGFGGGFGGGNPGGFGGGNPGGFGGGNSGGFGGGNPGGFGGGNPGGFGGGNNDPFGGGFGGGNQSIFQTAPQSVGFNPGGGPDAFKDHKNKPKKVEKGPKEFNDLFSMADKIKDRTNQPSSSVDDYVTSYKNGNETGNGMGMGGGMPQSNQSNDMFGGNNNQPSQSVEDDFFGGGGMPNNTGNPGNDGGQQDPFGGMDNNFGGDDTSAQNQPSDFYGGQNQPISQNNQFGGAPQPSNGGSQDMFGGGMNQPGGQADQEKNKQEELFDIFG